MMRGDDNHGGDEGGKQLDPNAPVDLPKGFKAPEAFRKEVLEGLGGGGTAPRLKDAVKRYAEGLIK